MESHQIFITILSIFVFVALTALFSFLIGYIIKQQLKLIKGGLEDEDITKEYQTEKKKKGCLSGIVDKIVSVLICALLGVVLISAISVKVSGDEVVKGTPTLKVVSSNSMSVRYERNKYLFDNNITNQLQLFDLVVLHELPKEEDLKLYDIVVYQHINGTLLIHRIVGIEEPNSYHPNERYFMMQGDAVAAPDVYPVRYSQMKSIYRGERMPNVGSFVYFMQSPAGTLCFLLVVFAVVATPIIERSINRARKNRWALIGGQAVVDLPIESADAIIEEQAVSVDFYANRRRLTFAEKLALLNEERTKWFDEIVAALSTVPKVKILNGKRGMTFRRGNDTLAKIGISGKTLVVNLAVNPEDYSAPKYGVKDNSSVKAFRTCPARFRVTSERRAGYVKNVVFDKLGGIREEFYKGSYYGRKKLSFRFKLSKLSPERKGWYKEITAHLKLKENLTKWDSKKGVSYKKGLKPIAKITIKGKSLYVYLAVNPLEYSAQKYGVKDVSGVRAHANYPAQIKVTSARKVKYIKQIIDLI
ncbi:MAG: hypothetical protein IJX03_04675 [Clostridia bacterium]|nr:hypothetical protein [Clostridia bacterium]